MPRRSTKARAIKVGGVMPVVNNCKNCKKDYNVTPCREKESNFCCNSCKWEFNGWTSKPNTTCTYCKKDFHIKPSQKNRYKRRHGFFCSNVCYANFKRNTGIYDGNKNPNYRGITSDGGYPLRKYAPHLVSVNGLTRMKLHQAVCCEVLGVNRIGRGLVVHHRDCDVHNNDPKNLAVLGNADHMWLHKQFGNATLWAMMRGKVRSKTLCGWSDDPDRAKRLLDINVTKQRYNTIGIVVDGHLVAESEKEAG